jgi:hypothetical protein
VKSSCTCRWWDERLKQPSCRAYVSTPNSRSAWSNAGPPITNDPPRQDTNRYKPIDGGHARRENRRVASYWATDDGWPYRDTEPDVEDPAGIFDDDLLSIRMPAARLLNRLDPLERQVIAAHYGLDGPARSMKQLRADMGLPQAELRKALGSGLVKLRTQLSS